VIDHDKALADAVSMNAVAEGRKGYLGKDWRLGRLVKVVSLIRWFIFGDFGKNLFILVRIRCGQGS
jgi:hypothetical protein